MTDRENTADPANLVRALLARRVVAIGLADCTDPARVPDAAIERLLEQEVHIPEPSEEECARYYTVHEDEFVVGELVAARHILFSFIDGAPANLIRARAEQALQHLLRQPEGFAACAAADSNCPSAQQGGQLGQLSRGQCVPEFEQALFDGSETLGVLPRLVNTRFGFHIVSIDQRVPGRLLPFQSVRARIAMQLSARVQETALVQYVRVLAGQQGVIVPGFSAATSPLVQ